ncbi:GFA domain-containing protein [Mycena sanguinolenta]|uniref:GFA domain-containing protein n=1 Tax=Mycena sanguinolenta TaxID=230812 RepID=A0A8H7CTG9_9AGAR|nr:GFA domain-containing protein [Mycena sanguinolenta]
MPHKGTCLCGQTTIEPNSTHTEQHNVIVPKKDIVIHGPVKEYTNKAASGNPVTRVFCSNCGSAISHLTIPFGDAQAIQTGNFADFAELPVTTEYFVKDRWSGLQAIPAAAQVHAMPS